ncbi:MAG: hypothetical protein K5785_00750 [Nitrosarchaeum sp.]|nr:hypothetical protein [Nitrosarchaeum sp.]
MINGCECSVKIHDKQRSKRWEGIFKDDWIPVAGPAIRGFSEFDGETSQPYHALAVYRMTQSEKLMVAQRTSEYFGISLDKMIDDLEKPNMIFPIIADDIMTFICPLHTRMLTT